MACITAALLLGYACGRPAGSKRAQKSGLEPILGSVDIPRPGSTLRATITSGGWALAESGVERVAIYIDKQFLVYATLDGSRPDIAKAFPAFPNAAHAGWGAVIDLSQMTAGNHELTVQVKTKAGNIHDFPPVPFKVL